MASSKGFSLSLETSNPPGSLTDRSHSTSTNSSHKENKFIEDTQQPKQNNKYQSRYSQSALEAERKKKKLEYSSFVVSTGTKKKKRTNVFARRQKAKMLQAKRERDELANRRKSQRTSKNLEAAREMLRLKALRKEERAKRRKILKDMMHIQKMSKETRDRQNRDVRNMMEIGTGNDQCQDGAPSPNDALKGSVKRTKKVIPTSNVNIVDDFADDGKVANDSGDDSNDEFDVVDETAIETEDQRIDRINTELKRLEDRDLVDDQDEDDTNDLIDHLLEEGDMELPKPRPTPRGWRDGFQANQPDVEDEKAIEAQNIMNEISNSTLRKKDPLSAPSGDKTQLKIHAWEKKVVMDGGRTQPDDKIAIAPSKPVWLQPPSSTAVEKDAQLPAAKSILSGGQKNTKIPHSTNALEINDGVGIAAKKINENAKYEPLRSKISKPTNHDSTSVRPKPKRSAAFTSSCKGADHGDELLTTNADEPKTQKPEKTRNLARHPHANAKEGTPLSSATDNNRSNENNPPSSKSNLQNAAPIVVEPIPDGGNLPTGNTLLSMFESDNDTDSDEELIATDMAGEAIIASSSIEKGEVKAPRIGRDRTTSQLSPSPITTPSAGQSKEEENTHRGVAQDTIDDVYGMYEEDGPIEYRQTDPEAEIAQPL